MGSSTGGNSAATCAKCGHAAIGLTHDKVPLCAIHAGEFSVTAKPRRIGKVKFATFIKFESEQS